MILRLRLFKKKNILKYCSCFLTCNVFFICKVKCKLCRYNIRFNIFLSTFFGNINLILFNIINKDRESN